MSHAGNFKRSSASYVPDLEENYLKRPYPRKERTPFKAETAVTSTFQPSSTVSTFTREKSDEHFSNMDVSSAEDESSDPRTQYNKWYIPI